MNDYCFYEINKYRFRIQTDGENSLDHTLDHRTLRKRYIYYGQKNSNFIETLLLHVP